MQTTQSHLELGRPLNLETNKQAKISKETANKEKEKKALGKQNNSGACSKSYYGVIKEKQYSFIYFTDPEVIGEGNFPLYFCL